MTIIDVAADLIIGEFLTKVTRPGSKPPFRLIAPEYVVDPCRKRLKTRLEELDAMEVEHLITIEAE